jgi:hypothetical protein
MNAEDVFPQSFALSLQRHYLSFKDAGHLQENVYLALQRQDFFVSLASLCLFKDIKDA